MANRSASTRRAGAATSRSGQAVTVFSGNNFSVAGAVITASTTINLDVVTPGQSSANSIVTPTGGGGATLTSVTKTDSNYSPTSGNIGPASYFIVTGTGFDANGNLYIGATNYANVYYSSTELRVNLASIGVYQTAGTYSLNYFNPNTSKFGNYTSGLTLTVTAPVANYLIVAGGGGGSVGGGGGGGAGGLIQANTVSLTSGVTYTVTVGAGGTGGTGTNQPGNIGTNSSLSGSGFTTVTAVRGGPGAGPAVTATNLSGGSGGGAARAGPYTGGNATVGQGFAGGNVASPNNDASAGGGGAGAKGADRVSSTVAGAGGIGLQSNITGTNTYYAGGGGGGGYTITTGGAGGNGGGGAGKASGNGGDATVNTGGGGGASAFEGGSSGGAGGSGVVIIKVSVDAGPATTTGSPTITTVGGYFIYKFTQSGTIRW